MESITCLSWLRGGWFGFFVLFWFRDPFIFFFQIFFISFNSELKNKKKHMQNGVVLVVLMAAITEL